MKPSSIAALAITLLTASGAPAQSARDASYVPMQVIETDIPEFPRQALIDGRTDGRSRVAVSIDDRGQLTDALLVAYTARSFGEVALASVRHWEFKPAHVNGAPEGATVDFTFEFKTEGLAVVDLDPQTYLNSTWVRLFPNSDAFHPWDLDQIDRIPVPVKIVRPLFSAHAAGGSVKVGFYIDPDGRVRMAAVDPQTLESRPQLAAAAVHAVSQWQFEPPTRKGQPVLVYAEQDFRFRPSAKTEAP